MEALDLDPSQAITALSALRAVATADEELDDAERELLCVQAVVGVEITDDPSLDLHTLDAARPKPRHRETSVQQLVPISMLAVAVAAAVGCGPRDDTYRATYELPAGYEGWVRVEHDVTGAPALRRDGDRRVLTIPPSGHLETSSPLIVGTIDYRFYAVAGDGTRTELPKLWTDPDNEPQQEQSRSDPFVCCLVTGERTQPVPARGFERFYVGTGPAGEPPD